MSLTYAIRLHENSRKFIESAIDYASKEWSSELTFAAIKFGGWLGIATQGSTAEAPDECWWVAVQRA